MSAASLFNKCPHFEYPMCDDSKTAVASSNSATASEAMCLSSITHCRKRAATDVSSGAKTRADEGETGLPRKRGRDGMEHQSPHSVHVPVQSTNFFADAKAEYSRRSLSPVADGRMNVVSTLFTGLWEHDSSDSEGLDSDEKVCPWPSCP